jgi:hypothetical protein
MSHLQKVAVIESGRASAEGASSGACDIDKHENVTSKVLFALLIKVRTLTILL